MEPDHQPLDHTWVFEVIMTMMGHGTRSVFDRYHIVSSQDLKDATKRLAGTNPDTVAGFQSEAER